MNISKNVCTPGQAAWFYEMGVRILNPSMVYYDDGKGELRLGLNKGGSKGIIDVETGWHGTPKGKLIAAYTTAEMGLMLMFHGATGALPNYVHHMRLWGFKTPEEDVLADESEAVARAYVLTYLVKKGTLLPSFLTWALDHPKATPQEMDVQLKFFRDLHNARNNANHTSDN